MKIGLWTTVIILTVLVIALLIKISLFQKSAREIEDTFTRSLSTDTNALIDISSGAKRMRSLANTINRQLRLLRKERHLFQQGDEELKNTITNISHDLRTPLTAICGYLDLLEQEDLSGSSARYTEIIRERTEILNQLTEELFRYSVLVTADGGMTKEPVAVNEVLEESIAAFYASLKARGITPHIELPDQKVVRSLNHSALSRVFSNLINNAMKYSDGDLDIILSETGEIIFSNTASGLDEIQVGKLFHRFYTVETARKSTGLGLAITRTLVEKMDGNILAEYKNDRLSIQIYFPRIGT